MIGQQQLPNPNDRNAPAPTCTNGHAMERREEDSDGMGRPNYEWYCPVCDACND